MANQKWENWNHLYECTDNSILIVESFDNRKGRRSSLPFLAGEKLTFQICILTLKYRTLILKSWKSWFNTNFLKIDFKLTRTYRNLISIFEKHDVKIQFEYFERILSFNRCNPYSNNMVITAKNVRKIDDSIFFLIFTPDNESRDVNTQIK